MHGRLYKSLLGLLAAALFGGASFMQHSLVRDREVLGLNRFTELKGAPPILSLITVALGGFRGLISNVLWIRASDLQDQEKYFEMVQLADWITKLEPHFPQVWAVQAWNMAYNISVKFTDFKDRWRWVKRGIELLRDGGLKYNPYDVVIHQQLALIFQHKMGEDMDDANRYYKNMWADEMEVIFPAGKPDWDELINPQTADGKRRSALLRDTYKMDPAFMKQLDETYGPLEWRLPEAHAIYWASQGLVAAEKNERKINPDDLITLRRVVYQSMHLCFLRGRIIESSAGPTRQRVDFGPNLSIAVKMDQAFLQAMKDDPKDADHIATAHRNALRDVVYFFYTYNQMAEAARWYKHLGETYPDKPLLENQPDSLPAKLSLDDYAIARDQGEVGSLGHDKTQAVLMGLERNAFVNFAEGEADRFKGYDALAQKIHLRYDEKINKFEASKERLPIPSMPEIRRDVLDTFTPEFAERLKSQLPASWVAPPAPSTNSPGNTSTNAPGRGGY